jgi:hypothetical protein
LNFYSLLQSRTDILRFQFIQNAPDKVEVRLSLRRKAESGEKLVNTLRTEIAKRLGENVALDVTITDSFATSPDGKAPTFLRSQPAAKNAKLSI